MRSLVVGLPWLLIAASAHAETDESPTVSGASGLLRTASATAAPAGTLRAALYVDGFTTADWLCTRARPCVGGAATGLHRHAGATTALGVTIVDGLELFAALRATTDADDRGTGTLSVFGDTTLGARYGRPVGSRLHLGGAADVHVGASAGRVGLTPGASSFGLRALATVTLGPARALLGLGYTFDDSAALVLDVERARGQEVSRVERQGLGIQRADRLEPRVGVEWPTLDGTLRPFVEGGLDVPIDRQGWRCPSAPLEPSECGAPLPSRLTLGLRARPIAREGASMTLLAALDVGLGGVRTFSATVAPEPPWTAWFGVALSLEPRPGSPKARDERTAHGPRAPWVTVRGRVHPRGRATPVAEALVRFAGGVERPPLATDRQGVFGADLPPGAYEFEVDARGYQRATCGGLAIAGRDGDSALNLDCPLEPSPSDGPAPGGGASPSGGPSPGGSPSPGGGAAATPSPP